MRPALPAKTYTQLNHKGIKIMSNSNSNTASTEGFSTIIDGVVFERGLGEQEAKDKLETFTSKIAMFNIPMPTTSIVPDADAIGIPDVDRGDDAERPGDLGLDLRPGV